MSSTGYRLCQITDRLDPGAGLAEPLQALNRVLYCHRGSFTVTGGPRIAENEAWYGAGETGLTAGGEGAVIWRFELVAYGLEVQRLEGYGVSSTVSIDRDLNGPDPLGGWIMRCDSVRFPMGGCAFTHVHQGPGIRVLREGQIRIDTNGQSNTYLPGQAWFEPGPEPVFAQASELECSRFIRVMILPEDLKGKSSIQYTNPDDLDKPKTQRYKGYVDEPISI